MTLRKRGPLLTEVVIGRETAHIGRVFKLDRKQARRLVNLFLDSGKLEKFKRLLKKKMPDLNIQLPVPDLYRYLDNVLA